MSIPNRPAGPSSPNSAPGARQPGGFQRRTTDPYAHIRRNHRIKALSVRVIGPDGKQLGVMSSDQAIKLALQYGLDLVEVAATANPPVCRILDFGKYIYEEQKKAKASRSSATKIKEIELTARIEPNDLLTKLRHAEEFLFHGNKLKLRLKFRGREMAHTNIGFDVINRSLEDLAGVGHPDSHPKLAGRAIVVMVSPLPTNKRKPKLNPDLTHSSPPPSHDDDDKGRDDDDEDDDDGDEENSGTPQ